MKCAPSMAPVVEKDQQLPHAPWFLTAVTAPLATQSTYIKTKQEKRAREMRKQNRHQR